ncbi:MAG: pyridoxal-phosphate dependent enzyme [Calditrichaeota bacterium]|nr:pyridoxal-phosphate dependent enzyme [Calditrichota bacterium]
MPVTINSIREAHNRIKDFIHQTPVLTSHSLNRIVGMDLYFKCENFQKTGSFKIRGASNAVLSLSEEQIAKGVITHSSGNHGAALVQAALWRNIPSYVVAPRNSPDVKKQALETYKADVTFSDVTLESRVNETNKLINETGAVFIHPYDNDTVISGAGTCCLELMESVQNPDVIMAPIGGGGLMSGTSIAAKALSQDIKIIGCEPELADDACISFKSGVLQGPKPVRTIADGLRTALSERTFGYIKQNVDHIETVSEEEIIAATKLVWHHLKIVIELSSSVPFAAAIKLKKQLAGKRVGIIFSGGNADLKYVTSLF